MHRAGISILALLLTACQLPGHPTEHGGRLLRGTEGVQRPFGGEEAFSVSPTGKLLLVFLAAKGSVAGGQPTDRSDAEELVADLCWSSAGDWVYLGVEGGERSTSAPRSRRGGRWIGEPERGDALGLAVGEDDPEWRLVARPTGLWCSVSRRWGDQLLGTHGSFVVERTASSRIRVRAAWWTAPSRAVSRASRAARSSRASAARDRILLDYKGTLLHPDVGIDEVVVAPDGKRLAIVLSRNLGSFTGPHELFLISLVDGDPIARSLGRASKVRWTPNGAALLAVSTLPGTAYMGAIYRWDM